MDMLTPFLKDLLSCMDQDQQSSYYITDKHGRPLDALDSSSNITRAVFEEQRLWADSRESLLAQLSKIQKPIVRLLKIPGFRIAVMPVKSYHYNELYIWTAMISEPIAGEAWREHLAAYQLSPENWEYVFHRIKRVDSYGLSKAIAQLELVGNLCSRALQLYQRTVVLQSHLRYINELNARDDPRLLDFDQVMHFLGETCSDIAFCGYAELMQDQAYQVTSYYGGRQAESLLGMSFMLGEGLLGHVCLLGRPRVWDHVDHDPRAAVFFKKGLRPCQLVCVPVVDDAGVIGVIFAGTLEPAAKVGEDTQYMIQALAAMAAKEYQLNTMNRNVERLRNHLTVFFEIAKAINDVKDIKNIFFLLVDLSLSLVEGATFSYFLYRPAGSNKAHIISRGLSSEQQESLTQSLLPRLGRKGNQEPLAVKSAWDHDILISTFQDQSQAVQGFLAVSLPNLERLDEYKETLLSFTHLIEIAVQRIDQGDHISHSAKEITLLHEALSVHNAEAYWTMQMVHELVHQFALDRGVDKTDLELLSQASLISCYPAAFLKEHLSSNRVIYVVEEAQEILNNQTNHPSWNSQVLALALAYVSSSSDMAALEQPGKADPRLQEEFQAFIRRKQRIEDEVLLNEAAASYVIDYERLEQAIRISPREKEVWELIVKGCNNKEIAEALFISEHTVKNHITNLFQKLNVTDRSHAIALAYQRGYYRGG